MSKFEETIIYEPIYNRQYLIQRDVAIELGVITKEEALKLTDEEVVNRLNNGDYLIMLGSDNSFGFVPKSLYPQIKWISR